MTQKTSLSAQSADEATTLFPETETVVSTEKKTVCKRRTTRKKKTSKSPVKELDIAYQPEYAELLLSFFDVPAFRVTEVQKKDGSISLLETAAELPTFAAFARSLGTTQAQLMRWEADYPEFAQAAKKARDLQGDILIQNSLRGNYSSSFAVFTAKNLLGWSDGKESTLSTPQTLVVRWEK